MSNSIECPCLNCGGTNLTQVHPTPPGALYLRKCLDCGMMHYEADPQAEINVEAPKLRQMPSPESIRALFNSF